MRRIALSSVSPPSQSTSLQSRRRRDPPGPSSSSKETSMKKMLLICLMAAGAFGTPRQNLVVDAAWLKAHLADPDLVLLHVGDKAEYEAGHICCARFVSLQDISISDDSGHGLMLEMPPAKDLRHRLEALGISDKSRVVVY